MTESRLDQLFGRRVRTETPKALNPAYLQRKWLEVLPAACRLAVQSSQILPYSYRNFRVGSAMFCYCSRTGEFDIVTGGNFKLCQGCDKFCAEMCAKAAVLPRFDRIVGIAIYGEQIQPDPSGLKPDTLHPCPPCRVDLEEDPRVARWTRMFMFRPWTDSDPLNTGRYKYFREHMSFRQLIRKHANGHES